MPAKQKPGDLVICQLCGSSLSGRDSNTHKTVCTEEEPFVLSSGLADTFYFTRVVHPVIYGEVLMGKQHYVKAKEIQDQTHLKQSHGIILLNPAVMRQCKFCFARPVTINRSMVFQAWPSLNVPVGCVGLEKESLQFIDHLPSTDFLMVESLEELSVEASKFCCDIQPEADSNNTDQFRKYVIKFLVGRYIGTGCVIFLDYYGQEHRLIITKVTGVDGTENVHFLTNSADSIADQMEAQCSVSGKPVCTSTPSKSHLKHDDNNTEHAFFLPEKTFYMISHNTTVEVMSCNGRTLCDEVEAKKTAGPTLEDFGGYSKQVEAVRDMITNYLFRPPPVKDLGLHTPQGVLLYGPSGSGKTMLAQAVAAHFSISVVTITGTDIWSKFFGETEARLNRLFEQAKERAPSVLLLDELNALCPKRESSRIEVERRAVAAILMHLDKLSSSSQKVFIIATTNSRNDIDVSVRRPGRLDTEMEIGVPTVDDRYKILKRMLQRAEHEVSDVKLKDLADRAHGYLGSDFSALCKEATLHAVRRKCSTNLDSIDGEICLTLDDLNYGLQIIKPSAMKEVTLEIAKVSWCDIGGQEDLKHKLRQAVEWPLKHPEAFKRLGIRPPRGLLMYGPPGCSKTMIARALAKESGLNFIAIKGPELFSKWVGESERAVRDVFARARAAAPAIVFFDEIDALASARGSGGGGGGDVSDRVLAQLLTEMDGVETLKDILVIAATNRPDLIDKALMRPGRLDRIVYVPLPDAETRNAIFMIKFKTTPVAEDVSVDELVTLTERYSGAEVAAVCHEAALSAMQEDINIDCVHRQHLIHAVSVVTPRITPELLAIYDKYQSQGSTVR